MSISAFLSSLAGVTTYFLLEAVYYELKARWRGRQYELWLEELEEELEN
jgi:hypothetical protein